MLLRLHTKSFRYSNRIDNSVTKIIGENITSMAYKYFSAKISIGLSRKKLHYAESTHLEELGNVRQRDVPLMNAQTVLEGGETQAAVDDQTQLPDFS